MDWSDLDRRWVRWSAAVLLFTGTLWWMFPVDQIERALQNTANRRLPGGVLLQEFSLESPFSVSGTVFAPIGDGLQFPFRLEVSPGLLGERKVNLLSPPDSTDSGASSLGATYRPDTGTITFEASKYSLSNILPDQEGNVTGSGSGTIQGPPKGQFQFSVTTESLIRRPPIPPLAHGLTVEKFTGTGNLRGRRLQLTDLDFKSDQFHFTGQTEINFTLPFNRTTINLNLKLNHPVEQTVSRTVTLDDLGL